MRPVLILALAWFLADTAQAQPPRLGPPPDFKVHVDTFGPRKEPIRRGELLARKGRAYWLLSDTNEVIIYERTAAVLTLLDLEAMERTELALKRVDETLNLWRKTKLTAAEKLQSAGGRAKQLAAGMGRDLLEPKFQVKFDAAANRLIMTNSSVEVDALGEPDPEPSRRVFEAEVLSWILKLETVRNPDAIPPFAALDAVNALVNEHSLRPLEITVLYRLAGPPRKVRWTYKLQPALTDQENTSIAKIDMARKRAKLVRFDKYEADDEP